MGIFVKICRDILSIPDLRNRVLFTFGMLAIYRIGFHIYLPGVDVAQLESLLAKESQSGSGLFHMIYMTGLLTGGQLQNATIFSLGIMPYISASIIFSLLVKVFPKLEALQKEGEQGRRQINRYTRYSTVLLCVIQGAFIYNFLTAPTGSVGGRSSISEGGLWLGTLQITILTAGTMFLMWLGEKITEFGIGNGSSLIIMAGILSSMPPAVINLAKGAWNATEDERAFHVLKMLILVLLFLGLVAGVVFITRGQRRIPIQQARAVKGRRAFGGQKSYMPIRVNSAGVLPIIFAQSLILIPSAVISYLFTEGNFVSRALDQNGFLYPLLYTLTIGFFTYFWTSLMFNPNEISEQMKEYGSFIPGIRPGRRTAEYLQQIINRITLAGATFLSLLALIPQFVANVFEVNFLITGFMGGTSILIVVGVALDLVDKVEAQLLVRHYEGFMRSAEEKSKAGAR